MKGDLKDCPQCGTTVNRFVNGTTCWKCHEDVFEPDPTMGGYRCLAM